MTAEAGLDLLTLADEGPGREPERREGVRHGYGLLTFHQPFVRFRADPGLRPEAP